MSPSADSVPQTFTKHLCFGQVTSLTAMCENPGEWGPKSFPALHPPHLGIMQQKT